MESNTDKKLGKVELRSFGLTTGAIIAVLFGVLIPLAWDFEFPLWPWVVLVISVVWALTVPKSLQPVYRVWMKIGLLISKVTTPILIGVMFVLIVVPVGFAMRLFRGDPLDRQFDADLETYRKDATIQPSSTLERPY